MTFFCRQGDHRRSAVSACLGTGHNDRGASMKACRSAKKRIAGLDRYPDFSTLAQYETLDQDYRIRVQNLGSGITIAALHGGLIEPRTSLIAELVADTTYNWYCFEGMKQTNNQDLHITSHLFDEPVAMSLISTSEIVITVHACRDTQQIVYIGGLLEDLVSPIQDSIEGLGIETGKKKKFAGTHPDNFCNKGKTKKGVQLEFSRGLRDDLDKLVLVSAVIRNILDGYILLHKP